MDAITRPLVFDLIDWLGQAPRPYAEVLDAWRTSCPRLTVWEDALDAGFIACVRGRDGEVWVQATEAGLAASAKRDRPLA